MCGGDRGRLEIENCHSSEDCLCDHGGEGSQRELAEPGTAFDEEGPGGDRKREDHERTGDHAVAPFKAHASDQMRHFYQIAERGRPIRHRKTRIVAGDRRAKHDHKEREARGEHRECVVRAMVRSSNSLQSVLLGLVNPAVSERNELLSQFEMPRTSPWVRVLRKTKHSSRAS